MSILAMTWAWGLMDLDQSQTLVLLALADAANDDGVCWPSQAELGRKARLKDRAGVCVEPVDIARAENKCLSLKCRMRLFVAIKATGTKCRLG